MKTAIIVGNDGSKNEVFVNLPVGTELICHTTQRSTSGAGLWSSVRYDSFEKGKEYKVTSTARWGQEEHVAYATDEDGVSTWVTPQTFAEKYSL